MTSYFYVSPDLLTHVSERKTRVGGLHSRADDLRETELHDFGLHHARHTFSEVSGSRARVITSVQKVVTHEAVKSPRFLLHPGGC